VSLTQGLSPVAPPSRPVLDGVVVSAFGRNDVLAWLCGAGVAQPESAHPEGPR
jgi:hypothetical protein